MKGLMVSTVLLSAVLVAGCAPKVTAAPAPETKASPVVQTAAPGEGARFFLYVETLTADRPSIYGIIAQRGCIPSGVFNRGERIVWRFEILDVATGKTVTNAEAEGVTLKLPYGYQQQAEFKQRGEGRVPDAPWTWDVCWDAPLDYPLGVLDYSIAIKLKDGRSGNWKPPALVDPGRGIDSRPQIIG